MGLFTALGFSWDRSAVPLVIRTHSIDRAAFRFHRMLPEFVWDASMIEGNPFTFIEVKTLLDGVTVGGRKISDQEQVLNLAASAKQLLRLVKSGSFGMNKETFADIQALVARSEALECGRFRGVGKCGQYTPLATEAGAPELNRVFAAGLEALQYEVKNPFEAAAAFFLFGALQKFFFAGNKRTSMFMMNGILMSAGIDAISIPAAKASEFNELMARFYLKKDATKMMAFLFGCHPDVQECNANVRQSK